MESLVYIALFSPFIGSLFAGLLFGNSPRKMFTGWVASAFIFVTFLSSVTLAYHVATVGAIHVQMMDWITAGDLSIPFGFVIDQISVTMMVVVSLVSTIVHIYATGYMDHDKAYNRFFSYLSAFVFAMMILIMSDNFVGLFIGWEGVGVCSWLLVGFWYHKEDRPFEENPSISPSWAANEAFIMNRVADLGMLVPQLVSMMRIPPFFLKSCAVVEFPESFCTGANIGTRSSAIEVVLCSIFSNTLKSESWVPFLAIYHCTMLLIMYSL